MNKFEFVAVTSKDDMLIGLCLPAIVMLPILTAYLLIFYLNLNTSFKDFPLLLRSLVFITLLYLMYFLINKLREYIANKFVVTLDNLYISILKNENEIMSGKLMSCKIKVSNDKLVHIDIKTEQDSISLRARPKEYKSITGNSSFNPFGTGTKSDMEDLLALGRKIQNAIEKQNKE